MRIGLKKTKQQECKKLHNLTKENQGGFKWKQEQT